MRRLPRALQAAAVLAGAAALYFTPTGTFLRTVPFAQWRWNLQRVRAGATMEERRLATLGPDYALVRLVRDHTPPDAVVLMADAWTESEFDPLKAKNQRWVSYFLYPRRVLYLHQDEVSWYRDASWLMVDSPAAVSWVAPEIGFQAPDSTVGCIAFNMDTYLRAIEGGQIATRYLPPFNPLPPPGGQRSRTAPSAPRPLAPERSQMEGVE